MHACVHHKINVHDFQQMDSKAFFNLFGKWGKERTDLLSFSVFGGVSERKVGKEMKASSLFLAASLPNKPKVLIAWFAFDADNSLLNSSPTPCARENGWSTRNLF